MKSAPPTVDAYLAGVPDAQRIALERLRGQIRAAVPDAVETISYGMPAYRLDGRYLVGFSAAKRHCSFYAGRAPIVAAGDALVGYRTLKGTVNFNPDAPLPQELVTTLVRLRVAEFRAS